MVSTFNGEVKIQHDGAWETVTKVGNRIRNSSVYNGDTVLTMPGASVDLVFTDNTHLKVEEDTTLTISIRQITEKERAKEGFVRNVSGTRQEVVRNINVKAGKLWADITPSKSVLTEFESPTGVASVRGTTLIFAFLGGVTGIDLTQGLLDFISAINNLVIDFNSGDALNISEPEPGKTKIDVASGEITLNTSEGKVTIGDGATLNIEVNPDTGVITVVSSEGNVTITRPDGITEPVGAGDNLGTAGSTDGDNGNDTGDDGTGDDDTGGDDTGGDFTGDDGTEDGDTGDDGTLGNDTGDDNQTTNTDPFFGASQSQTNQTQQESSDNNDNPITGGDDEFSDNFSNGLGDKGWAWENVLVSTSFGSNISAISGNTNDKFAIIHVGSDGLLTKTFNFQESGNRNITFDYNFVSTMQKPILTFDDTGTGSGTPIPNGYGGLDWSNMYHLDGTDLPYTSSGYENGIVSDTDVAYNAFGNNGTITKSSTGTFDFAGTYASAAWRDGLQVMFTGYADDSQLYSVTKSVDHTGPNWYALKFTGIDTLKIFTSGGTEVPGLSGNGAHAALDNFAVSDSIEVHLHKSDGTTVTIPLELNVLTAVSGLPTDKFATSNGYQTGWLSADWYGYVPSGDTTLEFHLYNDGDNLQEGVLLVDNVVDPLVDIDDETSSPSTNYLLSFAKMLRGDGMDSDDVEDPDGIEGDLASNINNDSDHEVSLEAIRESLVVVKEFMENHINDFGNAINHNEIKAQLDTLLAKIDTSMNSGGGISSSLRNDIETVLYSIIAAHKAHCEKEGENCEYAYLDK